MTLLLDIAPHIAQVHAATPGAEVYQRFQNEPDTLAIAVVDDDGRPIGLVERNERGNFLTLPAQLARQITESVAANVSKLMQQGFNGVVLCSPQVRAQVRKLIESSLPAVAVLSYNEIVKGINVDSIGMVGVPG